ncbi:hypothetical protein CONCODRAFT_7306 [Conidiobolus coronatus NRRL 28638]|uniref:Transcription factor domain-containing protein n=1 Tax=Conidiobolus coronatus (strain ATCC 28846 / CBS 209.66 / NRRL 28638) TaxID=796925 RepID=A0A137P583_CONC2|nr:hypothetical protein CONCODRAFT_7306 [Conidiobolus coronatus NRRL 28638]|eukprot:KXN70165.1 hypothetical protein CONCODRAFT_7306 [Conidiobolus coronatus NRRL 28638]
MTKIKPKKDTDENQDNRKIYYYRFQDRHTKSRLLLNNSNIDIGFSLNIQPSTSSTRDLKSIENNELFLSTTLSQFKSFKEFVSCIIQSDQISFSYFVISCSSLIQNLPKFQRFIKSNIVDLSTCSLSKYSGLPYPLTKPLQLLCQTSFWDNLISVYFQEFHPILPLFSIQSFNSKTISHSLLSAMYFCAYQFSTNQPKEVSEYMEKLEKHNIKNILKNITLDNIRTLVIHTAMAQWGGKMELAKSLQSHLSRMSYLLGLHLDYGKLSPIDRYNRNILFCIVRKVNIELSGSRNFTPNYLTELGNNKARLYDPKWHLPSPHSPLYLNNPLENQLYSLCLTQFFKFNDISSKNMQFHLFYNKEASTFNSIWNSKVNAIKVLFEDAIGSLKQLKLIYKEFQQIIDPFEIRVRMAYHESMIKMYEVLKHKYKSLSSKDITNILEHCDHLHQEIIANSNNSIYSQFFAHIVGLNYLSVYSKCTTFQKQTTKQRLHDLILYMNDRFVSNLSLNYLVLKTGFESLDEN